jgi:DNA-binding XRE family transcriptional regulator
MFISINKLKTLRKDKGWSQELLAKMSGLSVRTIQRVESDGKASAETLLSIASVFDLSPKELQATTNEIEVNWSGKKIMKNIFVMLMIAATVITAMSFGHNPFFYINVPSVAFVFLFTYLVTIIAFGTDGMIKSIASFKYLFTDEMAGGAKATYFATILNAQIKFCYGSALLALLIGTISIHGNHEQEPIQIHYAWTINLLALFWAALFCEAVLRPLKVKLATCDMPS